MENSKSSRGSPFLGGAGLVVLLGALTALDPLTIDMYLPAFGPIREDFRTSMAYVELSVSTFFVGMAFGQLFYGPLADRFGRRKPLLAGMLLYFAATIGCAFAPTIEFFIVFRLLQALGGCAGMVISRAVIRDLFDKQHVANFLSNMALVMGLAPIIAPSIGTLVNQALGWRAIFFLLALVNIICMVSVFKFLPETSPAQKSALHVRNVFKAYGSLLKDRQFVGYLIPDMALRAGMFAYIAGSPFVFIEVLGIPAQRYGLIFGLNGLGLLLASQANRQLLKFWPSETILRLSVRAGALAALIVYVAAIVQAPAVVLLTAIFIFLATLNFVGPNSLAGALSEQGHQAGTASALYGCAQWSMASITSFFVGYFHNGTALPMTGVILFCGALSFGAFQFLVPRENKMGLRKSKANAVDPTAGGPGP